MYAFSFNWHTEENWWERLFINLEQTVRHLVVHKSKPCCLCQRVHSLGHRACSTAIPSIWTPPRGPLRPETSGAIKLNSGSLPWQWLINNPNVEQWVTKHHTGRPVQQQRVRGVFAGAPEMPTAGSRPARRALPPHPTPPHTEEDIGLCQASWGTWIPL